MKRKIYFTIELMDSCGWHVVDGERRCSTPFGEVAEDQDGKLWLLRRKGSQEERLHIMEEGGSLLIRDKDSEVYGSPWPIIEYDTFFDEVIDFLGAHKYLIIFACLFTYIVAWAVDALSMSRFVSAAAFFCAILTFVHLARGGQTVISYLKSCFVAAIIYCATLFFIITISGVFFITLGAMGIIYITDAIEFFMGSKSVLDFFVR